MLRIEMGSPWVYGALVNNVWPLSSDQRGGSYSNFLLQPFVNDDFPGGFYVNSAPIVTASWKAASGQQWTVPLRFGLAKILHLGKLPLNTRVGAYVNVVYPDNGPHWQLRLQAQVLFPK